MKRTRKNQILAWLALFAIFFWVISTAILVMLSPVSAPGNDSVDLDEVLKWLSWTIVEASTGNSLTWTSNK